MRRQASRGAAVSAIIAVRVNDGVVLAAEGRTLIRRNSDGETLAGFDHAGKVFPLSASPAIACATCGAGSIGGLSMRFIAGEIASASSARPPAGMKDLIDRAAQLILGRSREAVCPGHNPHPDFEWLIGGYEGEAPLPSLWRLTVRHGQPQAPLPIEQRLVWSGEGAQTIDRLIGGAAPELPALIRDEVADRPTADRLVQLLSRLHLDLVHPEMPLGDAVALARLLLTTAIGIERLRSAVATAGGGITIAVIDRHRGFRYLDGEPL
jgi:hypothetical protein